MSEVSICTCTVALDGDIRQVVNRGPTRPVTWPEAEVLMHLHGEDAVGELKVIDKGDTTIAEEFERLSIKYGQAVCAQLFPGRRPAMQLKAPDSVPRVAKKDAPDNVADPFAGAKA